LAGSDEKARQKILARRLTLCSKGYMGSVMKEDNPLNKMCFVLLNMNIDFIRFVRNAECYSKFKMTACYPEHYKLSRTKWKFHLLYDLACSDKHSAFSLVWKILDCEKRR
jgi:hypothetical protein